MDKITHDNWPEDWSKVPAWTEVSEDVYDHFLNVLPPLCWFGNYFQCSEPYSHEESVGLWRGKYLTFTKQGGNCWFLGIQFAGHYVMIDGKEVS
jgi:hypothetical protein